MFRKQRLLILGILALLVGSGILITVPIYMEYRQHRLMLEETAHELWSAAYFRSDTEASLFMNELLVAIRSVQIDAIPLRPLLLEARLDIPEQHPPPELVKIGWDDTKWQRVLVQDFGESPNGEGRPAGFAGSSASFAGAVDAHFGVLMLQWLREDRRGKVAAADFGLEISVEGGAQKVRIPSYGSFPDCHRSGYFWYGALLVKFVSGNELAYKAPEGRAGAGKEQPCIRMGRDLLAKHLRLRVFENNGPRGNRKEVLLTVEGREVGIEKRRKGVQALPWLRAF